MPVSGQTLCRPGPRHPWQSWDAWPKPIAAYEGGEAEGVQPARVVLSLVWRETTVAAAREHDDRGADRAFPGRQVRRQRRRVVLAVAPCAGWAAVPEPDLEERLGAGNTSSTSACWVRRRQPRSRDIVCGAGPRCGTGRSVFG